MVSCLFHLDLNKLIKWSYERLVWKFYLDVKWCIIDWCHNSMINAQWYHVIFLICSYLTSPWVHPWVMMVSMLLLFLCSVLCFFHLYSSCVLFTQCCQAYPMLPVSVDVQSFFLFYFFVQYCVPLRLSLTFIYDKAWLMQILLRRRTMLN